MTHLSRIQAGLLATVLFALPAIAEEAGRQVRLDIERYRPAVDGTAGFAVGDPRGLDFGQFALSLNFHNAFSPLVLAQESGERVDLVSNRLGGTLSALVGIGFKGMLSLGVDVPFVLSQSGSLSALPESTRPRPEGQLDAVAMGDLRVSPRVALLSEKKDGVDLAVDASLFIPTGNARALTGDVGLGGSVALTVARSVRDLRFLAQVGARLRSNDEAYLTPVGSEFLMRGAAIYKLNFGAPRYFPRQLIGEVDSATLFSSMFDGDTTAAEWRVGARFCPVGHLTATVGGGGGLSRGYGTPFARANLGVGWDPRACAVPDGDRDGDGIPDSEDECPTVPGVWEHRGCPPPEAESAVVDEEVPPAEEVVPAPVVDGDDDATPPPADRDGDGVPDDEDECPDEPGLPEYAGCPRKDTDGDGLFDDEDKCPNEPGPAENQGCPYPDSDGDGIPDHEDNCPNEPGPASNHGCKEPQTVVIRQERIEILESVLFATGNAEIDKRSFKLLNQVAAVIREHSRLRKIRIEGHTDNVGSEETNRTLSQNRAEAVRDYLVRQGVDASRLDAVGYGQERPIAPNITRRGREANRRVEFVIVDDGRTGSKATTGGDLELELEPVAPTPIVAPAPEPEPAPEPAPVILESSAPVTEAPPPVVVEEAPGQEEPTEASVEEAPVPEPEALMGFDDMLFDLPPLPED